MVDWGDCMDEHGDSGAYFEVKQLQLLDVLHSTRSVTRTADRLGQTQPTISTWLKQIRDKVGDPLFIRTAKEMIPTPRADQIVEKARAILEAMRCASSAVTCRVSTRRPRRGSSACVRRIRRISR